MTKAIKKGQRMGLEKKIARTKITVPRKNKAFLFLKQEDEI